MTGKKPGGNFTWPRKCNTLWKYGLQTEISLTKCRTGYVFQNEKVYYSRCFFQNCTFWDLCVNRWDSWNYSVRYNHCNISLQLPHLDTGGAVLRGGALFVPHSAGIAPWCHCRCGNTLCCCQQVSDIRYPNVSFSLRFTLYIVSCQPFLKSSLWPQFSSQTPLTTAGTPACNHQSLWCKVPGGICYIH